MFAYTSFVNRPSPTLSANALRREVHDRNLERSTDDERELTYGRTQGVIYRETKTGGHGNFIAPSYRRILANADWQRRLGKTYTSSARVPRSGERWRGELECAASSDALLMNVFCYPQVLCRAPLCAMLGIERGVRPEFGVRAGLAMRNGEVDRTELDMRLGAGESSLIVEAKLTEAGFGKASRERLLRYADVEEVFDLKELPWQTGSVHGYQLIRSMLAARAANASFAVICDQRRADHIEICFRVLRAVRHCDVRSRMKVLPWQELATMLPPALRRFLEEKYGIVAAASR